MKRLPLCFLAMLLTLTFFSCESTSVMERNYQGASSQGSVVEPELIFSSNINFDRLDFETKGYRLVGSSSFTAKEYSRERLINQVRNLCMQHGATHALYGAVYRETVTRTTYESYKVLVSPKQGDREAVYVTEWRPVESSERYFDYYAYLYVPMTQAELNGTKLGMDFEDLDTLRRMELKRNTGAYVRMVYQNSPAFIANIVIGDVVTAINGTKILDASSAESAIEQLYSRQTVQVTVYRDGREQNILVTAE